MGTYFDLQCHINRQITCNIGPFLSAWQRQGTLGNNLTVTRFKLATRDWGFWLEKHLEDWAGGVPALPVLGLQVYIQPCSSRELPVHGWGRDPADSPCLGHLCTRLMQCIPLSWAERRAGAEKHLFSPGAERASVSRQHLHTAWLPGSGGFLEPVTVLQKFLPSPA